MEENLREFGIAVLDREKEFIFLPMVIREKVFGEKIRESNGLIDNNFNFSNRFFNDIIINIFQYIVSNRFDRIEFF